MSTHATIERLGLAKYLAHPNYGSGSLQAFRVGPPAMVPWRRQNELRETDAIKAGRVVHTLLLEPELFDKRFVVKPAGMEFRSNENKAKRDEWLAAGLSILSVGEAAEARGVESAVRAKLAKVGPPGFPSAEHSVFWTCRESKLPCKTRPDWFDDAAAYDLKVANCATMPLRVMVAHCYKAGWMHQLAHHRAGLRAAGKGVKLGRLVVAAPEAPHAPRVWLFEVNEEQMDFLELENVVVRRGMSVCHEANSWPGSPDGWNDLRVPAWASIADDDLEGSVVDPDNPLTTDAPR